MCGSSEDLLELELSVDDSMECFLCDGSFEDIMFSFSPRNKIHGGKGFKVLKCDCKLILFKPRIGSSLPEAYCVDGCRIRNEKRGADKSCSGC